MLKKGDTLVEVCVAIGIFSLVAIGIASVMSSGTAGSQTALETTVTREELDAQADAIRFIHESYLVNKDSTNNSYANVWKKITSQAVSPTEANTIFAPETCSSLYDTDTLRDQKAFILNTRQLSDPSKALITIGSSPDVFKQTTTYPRLIYGNSSNNSETDDLIDDDNVFTNLYRAEGVYVIVVKDPNTTQMIVDGTTTSATSAYYDFYIRSCWYGSDADRPTTISTVIRLYDPPSTEDAQESFEFGNDKYVRIQFHNTNTAFPPPVLPYTILRIVSGETKKIADPNSATETSRYRSRFLCWGTNSSNCNGEHYSSGQSYSAPAGMTENKFLDLYAIWDNNPYTVTYNANGGKYSNGATTSVHSCAAFATCEYGYSIPSTYFSTPTRTDYRLMGWATTSNATSAKYTMSSPQVGQLTKSITLYAVWKPYYRITYYSNGGKFNNGATSAVDKCAPLAACESNYSVPSSYFSNPTRSGYKLMGWATASNASTAKYTSSSPKYGKLTGDISLYAVWKKYHYVNYYANGGTFSGGATSKTETCIPLNDCESNYSIPSSYFSSLSRTGYKFLGWSTSSGASSATYTASSPKVGKLTGDVNLYAVWVAWYTLNFYDTNNRTILCKLEGRSRTYSISSCNKNPTNPGGGQVFRGWSPNDREPYYNRTGSYTTYTVTDSGSRTSNLYPVWRVSITFSSSGWTPSTSGSESNCDIFNYQQPSGGIYAKISAGQRYGSWSYYNSNPNYVSWISGGGNTHNGGGGVNVGSGDNIAPANGFIVRGSKGKHIEILNSGIINMQGYCRQAANDSVSYTIGQNDTFELSAKMNTAGMLTHPSGYASIGIGPIAARIEEGRITSFCNSSAGGSYNFTVGNVLTLKIEKHSNDYAISVNGTSLKSCTVATSGNVTVNYSMVHASHACPRIFNVQLTDITMQRYIK